MDSGINCGLRITYSDNRDSGSVTVIERTVNIERFNREPKQLLSES